MGNIPGLIQTAAELGLIVQNYDFDFLAQQSTPLFVSLNKPATLDVEGFDAFCRDGLWVTTRNVPRTFDVPSGASTRIDLSWGK